MWGMIARMKAAPGARDKLIGVLERGTRATPGCISYVIAADAQDQESIWVTEIWDSQASHDASLGLPAVLEAISSARPMVAGFEKIAVTTPVGGVGLSAPPES